MADRLSFRFIKTGKIAQLGECTVDVLDPTDANEIAEKLKALNFSSFLIRDFEFEDEDWTFTPYSADDKDN